MARLLGRIWVRFGLWIAATVLLTIGVLAAGVLLFAQVQYRSFERALPPQVRQELGQLEERDLEDSPRALEIYSTYWKGDLLFGEKVSLLVGLAICLPFGLIAGFWVSRTITQPLESMATAAQHIARGDLSMRAEPGGQRGEMADMVRHFNDMTDALEKYERERKAATAAISHELRTPLTILRARLHAACDGVIAPSADEFRHLLDQVEHLGRLVDDLHMLSMAEAGRLPLHREPLDLLELARDALYRHEIRLTGLGIESHVVANVEQAFVDGDKDRLRQVISNLIENASRHARAGGWLQLELSVTDGDASAVPMAVLAFEDAGPGLSDEVRERLSRGFAIGERDSRAGGASGLGLSIVRMLVTQHGGDVRADRSSRGGTRFTVRLPLLLPRDGETAVPRG